MIRDKSSQSNPHEVRVSHLDWTLTVDFDQRVLRGEATYAFDAVAAATQPKTKMLDLDTAHLKVLAVTDPNNGGQPLPYKLHKSNPKKPHLGQKLSISLNALAWEGAETNGSAPASGSVTILYETTDKCTAIQWLPPSATAGKVHPYLFTQCQAIHARSLVPCQDLPGVKATYHATVTVPNWATCVMSAIQRHVPPSSPNGNGNGGGTSSPPPGCTTFSFEQHVPISSYLLALAVGDLVCRELSDRSAIWSEPSVVEAAAYEFAETESFLQAAESIAGAPYAWGRYDLLCLPPSCPYGGMENPCLTFVTPTLLAGDRSLADVVAHEIAHSWTGNLVTNASWDHFWLNEGWTTWLQRQIMVQVHGDPRFLDLDALGGWKSLQDTVEHEMPAKYTSLVLDIGDGDPDDAYSTVAYEKGFFFLRALEHRVGSNSFQRFFQAYVFHFSYKTVSSEEFKQFFLEHFEGTEFKESVTDVPWDAWLYAPGLPPEPPSFDDALARASHELAQTWLAIDRHGRMLPTSNALKSWSSLQVTTFLDALQSACQQSSPPLPLQVSTLSALNQLYHFSQTKNAEILHRYLQLAVAAEDDSVLSVAVAFLTSQGRMKFVRPLYRALHQSHMGRDLAVQVFLDHADFYHPICAKLVATDLCVDLSSLANHRRSRGVLPKGRAATMKSYWPSWQSLLVWSATAAGLAAAGVTLWRRSKRS